MHAKRKTRGHVVPQVRERAVGRSDHAHVGVPQRGLTQALILAGIQHAQQARLLRQRELGKLVEKQRALVRCADQTDALGHARIGEILGAAEQLGVDQRLREGGRVARDQRPVRFEARCTAFAASSLPVPDSP